MLTELNLTLLNKELYLTFNKNKTVYMFFYVNNYFIIFIKKYCKAVKVII